MKILFLAAGDITWGSSRMRCYWPAEAIRKREGWEADAVKLNDYWRPDLDHNDFAPFDVVVFQKNGAPDMQRMLLDMGKQVWLDVCDPLHWFSPTESKQVMEHVTGISASTSALAGDVSRWYRDQFDATPPPVEYVPDGFLLDYLDEHGDHLASDERAYFLEGDTIRFIWYGVAVNRPTLFGAITVLERLAAEGQRISMTIMDDMPHKPLDYISHSFPVTYVKWELGEEVKQIEQHDIALLPPYPGEWGKMKSLNKRGLAHCCGIPWVEGLSYDETMPTIEAVRGGYGSLADYAENARKLWDIEVAADHWRHIFEQNA